MASQKLTNCCVAAIALAASTYVSTPHCSTIARLAFGAFCLAIDIDAFLRKHHILLNLLLVTLVALGRSVHLFMAVLTGAVPEIFINFDGPYTALMTGGALSGSLLVHFVIKFNISVLGFVGVGIGTESKSGSTQECSSGNHSSQTFHVFSSFIDPCFLLTNTTFVFLLHTIKRITH
jgi:hypothetical protein